MQDLRFSVGDKIYGTMPVIELMPLVNPNNDRPDPMFDEVDLISFEGVVTMVSSDGKVKQFQLTQPINPENSATQQARKEGVLVDVGSIISIPIKSEDEWEIRLLE
jgi:hypothetical protein